MNNKKQNRNRNSALNFVELEMGKMPPQACELEEVILGALMLEQDAYPNYAHILNADLWYKDAHRLIYEAIETIGKNNKPIDILTVTNELRRTSTLEQCGGAYYISQLTSKIASSANIEYHIEIITEKMVRRQEVKLGSEMIENAYAEDVSVQESMSTLENGIDTINKIMVGHEIDFDISKSIHRTYERVTAPRTSKYLGLSTGNGTLTECLTGWNKPDYMLLMGRSSMGKTARMIDFATHLADNGEPVAIFSLEMRTEDAINIRLLSHYSGISSHAIRSQELDFEQGKALAEATERIASLPLYIYDRSAMPPNYIRTICRNLKRNHGLKMGFLDYIQLVPPNEFVPGRNREGDVSSVSAAIKNTAKDLDIPFMALSQMSRQCESRPHPYKRPQLNDLRESGSLEQDADVVLGLYMPSVYNTFNADSEYNSEYTEEQYEMISELSILKFRNGARNKSLLEYFDKSKSKYLMECPGKSIIINAAKQEDLPF